MKTRGYTSTGPYYMMPIYTVVNDNQCSTIVNLYNYFILAQVSHAVQQIKAIAVHNAIHYI